MEQILQEPDRLFLHSLHESDLFGLAQNTRFINPKNKLYD